MEQDNREIFNKNIDFKLWKKVVRYLGKYWKQVVGIIVAMIIQAATDAAFPLFTEYAIDNFIANKTTDGLTMFSVLFVFLMAMKGLTIYTFIYLADRLWHLVGHDIRVDGFKKLQELSFSYYDRNASGSLFTRITSDVNRLTGIIFLGPCGHDLGDKYDIYDDGVHVHEERANNACGASSGACARSPIYILSKKDIILQ